MLKVTVKEDDDGAWKVTANPATSDEVDEECCLRFETKLEAELFARLVNSGETEAVREFLTFAE
jgi:hypothetical protein